MFLVFSQSMLMSQRNGHKKTLVLITDGEIADAGTCINFLKSTTKPAGIDVLTIGVGNIQAGQLIDLASGPGMFIKAAGFSVEQLQSPVDEASRAMCGEPQAAVPCPGAAPTAPCGSLYGKSTDCCVCRKTKASGTVEIYASAPAPGSYYGSVPNCNVKAGPPLSPDTQVGYAGAKVVNFKSYGCNGDYARIVAKVRPLLL